MKAYGIFCILAFTIFTGCASYRETITVGIKGEDKRPVWSVEIKLEK